MFWSESFAAFVFVERFYSVFRASGDAGKKVCFYRAWKFLIKKTKGAITVGFHAKIPANIWKKQLTKSIEWLSFATGISVDVFLL